MVRQKKTVVSVYWNWSCLKAEQKMIWWKKSQFVLRESFVTGADFLVHPEGVPKNPDGFWHIHTAKKGHFFSLVDELLTLKYFQERKSGKFRFSGFLYKTTKTSSVNKMKPTSSSNTSTFVFLKYPTKWRSSGLRGNKRTNSQQQTLGKVAHFRVSPWKSVTTNFPHHMRYLETFRSLLVVPVVLFQENR